VLPEKGGIQVLKRLTSTVDFSEPVVVAKHNYVGTLNNVGES
jgi:hypothetical protein